MGWYGNFVSLPSGGILANYAWEEAHFSADHGVMLATWPPRAKVVFWDGREWNDAEQGTLTSGPLCRSQWSGEVFGVPFAPDGQQTLRLARWDGKTWQAVGEELRPNKAGSLSVVSLAQTPDGHVVASGYFDWAGTTRVKGIALWNGARWQELGDRGEGSAASKMVVRPNGNIIASNNLSFPAQCICDPDGKWIPDKPSSKLMEWNGHEWHRWDDTLRRIDDFALLPDGRIVAAGIFSPRGRGESGKVSAVAIWDHDEWRVLGGPFDGYATKLAILPGGNIMVAGRFRQNAQRAMRSVAMWDGRQWNAMGSGFKAYWNPRQIEVTPAGDIILNIQYGYEELTKSHTPPIGTLCRWNGKSWCCLDGSKCQWVSEGVFLDAINGALGKDKIVPIRWVNCPL